MGVQIPGVHEMLATWSPHRGSYQATASSATLAIHVHTEEINPGWKYVPGKTKHQLSTEKGFCIISMTNQCPPKQEKKIWEWGIEHTHIYKQTYLIVTHLLGRVIPVQQGDELDDICILKLPGQIGTRRFKFQTKAYCCIILIPCAIEA